MFDTAFDAVKGELYPTNFGEERCLPRHHFGPAVRDYYLVHYVASGRGIFRVGDREFALGAGQGFLIVPDLLTYYEADRDDPWHYYWIGFRGRQAEVLLRHVGLDGENPVFTCQEHGKMLACFQGIAQLKVRNRGLDLYLLGYLYRFFAILAEQQAQALRYASLEDRVALYIQRTAEFVKNNYSQKITIDAIAAHIGLNRSYLSALFKREVGQSLQQYLIDFRLKRACTLLKETELSVGDIARSVGYEDPLLFSKIFKKYRRVSPRAFRRRKKAAPPIEKV